MSVRGLRWSEAALAGACTGLAVLGAEGLVAAASRPSYRAALAHGAPWRLLLVVPALCAATGLLGWAVAATLGARGPDRREAALRGALLGAALPVLAHPLAAPAAQLLALWPSAAAGALLGVPLLLAALLARGRLMVLLPWTAAALSALLTFWLLAAGGDLAPAEAPADAGRLSAAPDALVALAILVAAALAVAPLARALRDAAADLLPRLLGTLGAQLALLLLAAWLAAPGRPPATGTSPAGPPVLLIVADTLRADHVTGFGAADDLTPRLAELARDGTSFTTAWSAAPWTTPSFGSLLTGRLPLDHGAGGGAHGLQPLHPSVPTLAGELAAHGWRTVALTSNPLLGRQLGLARGFGRYENALPPEWYHPLASWAMATSGLSRPYLPAAEQAERALEALGDDADWFVLAHVMDTHWPQQFPAELRVGERPGLDGDYRAATRAVDAGVGALLDGLRARGLYDRAIVIFTADHGEELDEARPESAGRPPWNRHGHTLNEELLHVPLVVKLPRGDGRLGAPGTVRADPVSLLDLMPTLLATLGILPPPELGGLDLLQPPAPRILLAEGTRPDVGGQMLAARRYGAKLVVRGLPPVFEHAQSLNLDIDPRERLPGPPEPGHPLFEALMVRWLRLSASPAVAAPVPERPLDEAMRERLRQLGYVR